MPVHLPALLAALLLALASGAPAAAAHAPSPPAAPTARTADALDDWGDDGCLPDDAWCEDDWEDDDALACDDALWDEDDGDWWDDEAPVALAAQDDDDEDELDDDWCDEGDDEAARAPRLTALRATVAGAGRRARVRIAFRLDRAARVTLTLAPADPAASRRAACARTARPKRGAKHRRCRAPAAPRGAVTIRGRAGANRVELRGRWRGRRLAPGAYRLAATPRSPGARTVRARFAIRR